VFVQTLHEEELTAAAANLASTQAEVERLQAAVSDKEAELVVAQDQVTALRQQLTELEALHGEWGKLPCESQSKIIRPMAWAALSLSGGISGGKRRLAGHG
jgi:DNA repair exonuclease SbcCD ATPase subunit